MLTGLHNRFNSDSIDSIALLLEFPSLYLLCANRSLILNVVRLKCDSFTIITEAYNVHFLYETGFIRKTMQL